MSCANWVCKCPGPGPEGFTYHRFTPRAVVGGLSVDLVSAGGFHTCLQLWEGLGKGLAEKDASSRESTVIIEGAKSCLRQRFGMNEKARKASGRTAKPPFVGPIPTGASLRHMH
jgi:hypothetical protein